MDFKKKFEIKKIIYHIKSHQVNKKLLFKNSFQRNKIKPCYYFTDRKKNPNLNQVIKNLPPNSGIIFREYDLSTLDRKEMASKYLKLAKKYKHAFIIGKDFKLALELKADGVHFSDKDNSKIFIKTLTLNKKLCQKNNLLFSYSCHRANQIKILNNYQPDLIFFSPIFETTSHNNIAPIGIFNFLKCRKIYLRNIKKNNNPKKISNFFPLNFFPLGGIDLQNLSRLNTIYPTSFGGIDYFKKL